MRSLNYDELFIGGRWRTPSTAQRLSVISPHTEQPIGETQTAAMVEAMGEAGPRLLDASTAHRVTRKNPGASGLSVPRDTMATCRRLPWNPPRASGS